MFDRGRRGRRRGGRRGNTGRLIVHSVPLVASLRTGGWGISLGRRENILLPIR